MEHRTRYRVILRAARYQLVCVDILADGSWLSYCRRTTALVRRIHKSTSRRYIDVCSVHTTCPYYACLNYKRELNIRPVRQE
jgi:hypothetical protein